MSEIIDKMALALGMYPGVNTEPPVAPPPPVEAPPPPAPAPPPDGIEPPVTNTAPPPPPVGVPIEGEPDPQGRAHALLRHALDTGDTDELARFLRDLRRSNATLARLIGESLDREVINGYYNERSVNLDQFMHVRSAISEAFIDPASLNTLPPRTA